MTYFPMPEETNVDALSDWVELCLIEKGRIAKSEVESDTVGSDVDIEYDDEETFEGVDGLPIDDIWAELKRRQELYGKKPPFIVRDNDIISRKTDQLYEMCLILSVYGNQKDVNYTGKLFERVSDYAIRVYTDGETIISGHPSKKRITDILKIIGEEEGKKIPSNYKEAGADIFVWKPFNDRRGSQRILIFQVAAGKNWDEKLKDVDLEWWNKHVVWAANPMKGFVMPKIITDYEKFLDISYKCGILIDRARIYRLTKLHDLTSSKLRKEVKVWCALRKKEKVK